MSADIFITWRVRQAVSDLPIEYCRAFDLMDLPAVARACTEDCEVES